MGDSEEPGDGIGGTESNCQKLLHSLVEKGNASALDVELIKSMADMGMRDPVTKVMLERVCAWKSSDLATCPPSYPPDSLTAGAEEEDIDATDDPAAALVDSILHIAGPKVAIFPDSFPAELEKGYLSVRSCANTTAVALIQDAAEKQHHLAEACLGALYERGCEGLTRDPEQAVLYASRALPWLQAHGRRGNKYAQYHLGCCCEDGRGVEKNETEALRWYTLAAEQGHAPAQCNLGICYENGSGVSRDPVEAVRLYTLAAEQALADAQQCLGVCYEHGNGVAQDRTEGARWYQLASEQGHINAQKCLEELILLLASAPRTSPAPPVPPVPSTLPAPDPEPGIPTKPPAASRGFLSRLFGRGGAAAASSGEKSASAENEDNVTAADFDLLKVVGTGQYSKVLLVRRNGAHDIGRPYAMKVLNKAVVAAKGGVVQAKTERDILQQVRHPYIERLRYAFQSEDKLYLITDYYNGGTLFYHLRKARQFPEDRAKFYAAQLLSALDHLHHYNIIYCHHLQPENVLMNHEGHLSLTSFSMSKKYVDCTDGTSADLANDEFRTHKGNYGDTVDYTPNSEYTPPEVLQGKRFGKCVDWWGFGILIYEMINGRTPFYERNRRLMVYSILNTQPSFPPTFSLSACDCIRGLLRVSVTERLGCSRAGARDIMDTAFFSTIDFDALNRREIAPPFRPEVADEFDTKCAGAVLKGFVGRPANSLTPMSAFHASIDQSKDARNEQNEKSPISNELRDAQLNNDLAERMRQVSASNDQPSAPTTVDAGIVPISRSELDRDLLDSVLQHPAARVLLERVVDWKAAEARALHTEHLNCALAEENDEATDVADTLLAEILGKPKIALYPDSFPAQLDSAYISARFCGNTSALSIILDAAEKEHHLAEAYLSILYEKGCKGLLKNSEKAEMYACRALPWLQTHASKGNKYAQFNVGFCYTDGRGVARDNVEALRWYQLASEQGHANAQCNLGFCHEFGDGVAKDPMEAVRKYKQAADQGHANAQGCLGFCYKTGTGVSMDPVEAVRLYRLAVEQGHANAQCNLGLCYEYDTGVTKDPVEAVRLYTQAAEQGYSTGQYYLALNLRDGVGVAQNLAEAKRYFQLAADQGHARATAELAKL